MTAVEELKAAMLVGDPFLDEGGLDLEATQLAAANERLREQRAAVGALDQRASEFGIDQFKSREDLVPLLFAHSVYKSYPESFVADGRWKNLSKWLNTVVTAPVDRIDMDDCVDIDDWLDRLEGAGQHVVVSSGTTGKNSFLVMDDEDVEYTGRVAPHIFGYPYRIPKRNDRPVTFLTPANVRMRFSFGLRAYAAVYARPGAVHSLTDERVRVADTLRQSEMRRAMADGSARPGDIARFESEMRERGQRVAESIAEVSRIVLGYRHEPQIVVGPWAMAWRLMEAGRAEGVPDGDFHPDTVVSIAGGLKGLTLPDDYQEQMNRFLGPVHRPKLYSMSEQSMSAPLCEAGKYHWPKAIMLFILDESGEILMPIGGDGRVTGRVGFYDPVWHGRWGGIVSGDKATVNYAPCVCGRPGPTIEDSITRFSELSAGGDDKLTCGGTIEQYIRGVATRE